MNNRFRAGRGVFTCSICKRRTRDSGQALSADCCFECYELAGLQNTVYDGVATASELAPERDRFTAIISARGGDLARVRREFSELWPSTEE